MPKLPALPKDGPALLKPFAKDGPIWRLLALLLVRLPWILMASSVPTLAFCKAKGWL